MDEKKIEEMRQVIQNASCKGIECEKCWLENSPTCVCVKALYNEGYRKESDTAKEICEKVIALYRQVMPLQKKGLFIAENAFICGVREIEKYFAEDKE